MAYKIKADQQAYTRQWQARPDIKIRRRLQQRARRVKPGHQAKEREWTLLRRYGIGLRDYDALLLAQNGRCAICGNAPTKQSDWHVDHDHGTGKVRGVLCRHCNRALGAVMDNPDTLQKAIQYLTKHRS